MIPISECFIQLQISKKLFRDRVIMIQNLKYKCILGHVLHRVYRFGIGCSTTGRLYITINGKSPILKTEGKITLPPMSNSVISVKMPPLCNTNDVYELNCNTFQLPEGVILLDILHKVNHKTPQYLNIRTLNTSNSFYSISRCSPLATLVLVGKCEEIQEVSWNQVQCNNAKLLPEILEGNSLELEHNTKSHLRSILDADIPEEARVQLQELLDWKYINIISQAVMDIGRTNLIELDIPSEGPLIASKPCTMPLKYHKFIDHKIK